MSKPMPLCPICGSKPTISQGQFGTKAQCCGLWSWNGKPLVGRETHRARIAAHEAFDQLWKSKTMSRSTAYLRLRHAMQMSADECHIAQMSEAQARRVIEIVASGVLKERVA